MLCLCATLTQIFDQLCFVSKTTSWNFCQEPVGGLCFTVWFNLSIARIHHTIRQMLVGVLWTDDNTVIEAVKSKTGLVEGGRKV
mmetsp:Transcript_16125/g.39704  ORF Transcript_16125/g.39704 Transcript_16125/m.39704 type:complete len:84 (+) Transcript_16125:84-335(+)